MLGVHWLGLWGALNVRPESSARGSAAASRSVIRPSQPVVMNLQTGLSGTDAKVLVTIGIGGSITNPGLYLDARRSRNARPKELAHALPVTPINNTQVVLTEVIPERTAQQGAAPVAVEPYWESWEVDEVAQFLIPPADPDESEWLAQLEQEIAGVLILRLNAAGELESIVFESDPPDDFRHTTVADAASRSTVAREAQTLAEREFSLLRGYFSQTRLLPARKDGRNVASVLRWRLRIKPENQSIAGQPRGRL